MTKDSIDKDKFTDTSNIGLYNTIFRPQEIDQVLFLGENSIRLMEFRGAYPQIGSPDYSIIRYGEPYFLFGIFKKEKTATAISNWRILKNQVFISGKRTLLVMADLDAQDKNVSLLDIATMHLEQELDRLTKKLKMSEEENMIMRQFMTEKNMETSWEEWLENKLELARVMETKLRGRPEQARSVSVEVGDHEKKKKE